MKRIRLSVRALVEQALRAGDLIRSGGGVDPDRMLEGQRAHQLLQSRATRARSEVAVSLCLRAERVELLLSGRIDILHDGETVPLIEEIKSCFDLEAIQPDDHPVHWAQAECYAHMLCLQEGLAQAGVRLTYIAVGGEKTVSFTRSHTAEALAARFEGWALPLLAQLDAAALRQAQRDESLRALAFPFDGYREGQRAMAANTYVALRDARMLLVEAPTGIGKTVSALYPALKAMGEGHTERIFYLTARTTARQVAEQTLAHMRGRGLRLLSITLTAKDKLCPQPGTPCHPAHCPRAEGHYDRLPAALAEAIVWNGGALTREAVSELAQRHAVCPFEFQLDASLDCDCIICDYNYVFDPRVRLQRFFEHGPAGALLVDEAHNLPDRAREMHSASLSSEPYASLRREWGKAHGRKTPLYRAIGAFLKAMKSIDAQALRAGAPHRRALERMLDALGEALEEAGGDVLADCFFDALWFSQVLERLDERYYVQIEHSGKGWSALLRCMHPAPDIFAALKPVQGAVFFSATLSPLPYFRTLFGLPEEAGLLRLPSPFPPENLRLLRYAVDTTYGARERTLPDVVAALAALCGAHTGNYLLFFPSYAYLDAVAALLAERLPPNTLLRQPQSADEAERERFLAAFQPAPETTKAALCVLGGVFNEGIDLPGDRLCGVAVVGVGLPQLNTVNQALRAYYDAAYGAGFAYAYQIPGLERVMQAVGRVIRSDEDRGVALLIDARYDRQEYGQWLPPHWRMHSVHSPGQVESAVREFWA